jgi:hypothetical protein
MERAGRRRFPFASSIAGQHCSKLEDLMRRIYNMLDIDIDFEALLKAECKRRCDSIYAKYDKEPDTRENRERMLDEQTKMIEAFVKRNPFVICNEQKRL